MWFGVNARMRTSGHHSRLTPPSPPRVSALDCWSLCSRSLPWKGYQFTSHTLWMLTRVLIARPLVKQFISFLLFFNVLIALIAVLQLKVNWNLYITVMALVGFDASAVQVLMYQNGDYMGRKEFYNGFKFVSGYQDLPILNTRMASAFLNLRGFVSSYQVSISLR